MGVFAGATAIDDLLLCVFFSFLFVNSIEKIVPVGLKHFASIPLAIAILFVSSSLCAETLVEFSMDKAPLEDGVGTCEYGPTEVEKSFDMRLSEDGLSTIETRRGSSATRRNILHSQVIADNS